MQYITQIYSAQLNSYNAVGCKYTVAMSCGSSINKILTMCPCILLLTINVYINIHITGQFGGIDVENSRYIFWVYTF